MSAGGAMVVGATAPVPTVPAVPVSPLSMVVEVSGKIATGDDAVPPAFRATPAAPVDCADDGAPAAAAEPLERAALTGLAVVAASVRCVVRLAGFVGAETAATLAAWLEPAEPTVRTVASAAIPTTPTELMSTPFAEFGGHSASRMPALRKAPGFTRAWRAPVLAAGAAAAAALSVFFSWRIRLPSARLVRTVHHKQANSQGLYELDHSGRFRTAARRSRRQPNGAVT